MVWLALGGVVALVCIIIGGLVAALAQIRKIE